MKYTRQEYGYVEVKIYSKVGQSNLVITYAKNIKILLMLITQLKKSLKKRNKTL